MVCSHGDRLAGFQRCRLGDRTMLLNDDSSGKSGTKCIALSRELEDVRSDLVGRYLSTGGK